MNTDIELEMVYPYPQERVWRAITDAKAMAEWLMENDFLPKVGHRFVFRAKPQPGRRGYVECHMMMNKALLSGAEAGAGDRVDVVMAKDEGGRALATPPDFARALAKSPAAKRTFGAKTDAFRNEYIVWIASAKQDETRKRRIAKAVDLIASGKRFSDK